MVQRDLRYTPPSGQNFEATEVIHGVLQFLWRNPGRRSEDSATSAAATARLAAVAASRLTPAAPPALPRKVARLKIILIVVAVDRGSWDSGNRGTWPSSATASPSAARLTTKNGNVRVETPFGTVEHQ